MGIDDGFAEVQPKPKSLLFGGEEWLKEIVDQLRFDAGAIVCNDYFDHFFIQCRFYRNVNLAVFANCFYAIDDQVKDNLVNLFTVH